MKPFDVNVICDETLPPFYYVDAESDAADELIFAGPDPRSESQYDLLMTKLRPVQRLGAWADDGGFQP